MDLQTRIFFSSVYPILGRHSALIFISRNTPFPVAANATLRDQNNSIVRSSCSKLSKTRNNWEKTANFTSSIKYQRMVNQEDKFVF